MTGEITLRGRVLPIGGLKSKILAAHLSGAKMVILPRKNEKDLRDIPDEIRKSMKLVLVDSMDQVLEAALRRKPKALETEPPKIVKGDDPLDPEPADPRSGGPTSHRPISHPSSWRATDDGHRPGGPMPRCRLRALACALGSARARVLAGALPRPRRSGAKAVSPLPWSTRTTTRSSGCRGPRHRPTSRRPSARLARQHHPDTNTGDAEAEQQVQGRQRGQRRAVRSGQADAVRPPRQGLGGLRQGGRRRGAGAPVPAPRGAAGNPFAGFGGFGGQGGNVRYEFHTSGDPGEFSDFFQAFFGGASEPLQDERSGRGRRPTGGRELRGHPRRHGPRRERRSCPAVARAAAARHQADRRGRRRDHPRRGLSRHDPSGRSRRQAARGHDPAGRRHRHPHPPHRQGARWRRPARRRPPGAGPDVHAPRRRPRARAPADAGRRCSAARSRPHAEGPRPADDPGRHPARPHLPPHRPGHAPLQGRGPRRPLRQGRRSSCPTDLSDGGEGSRRAFLDLVDQPDPRARET